MAHTYTKNQVQRLVGSKDRVETNERTDGRTPPVAFPANAVCNNANRSRVSLRSTFCNGRLYLAACIVLYTSVVVLGLELSLRTHLKSLASALALKVESLLALILNILVPQCFCSSL